VREIPGGEVVGSLPDGKIVRVKQAKDNSWFLIEYDASDERTSCPPSEGSNTIIKWTHKENLMPSPDSLERLVQSGKVLIAGQEFGTHDNVMMKLLGEELTIKYDDDFPQLGTPKNPLKLMVYCLDGIKMSNQILSVSYQYGGDAGSYLAKINTKRKVPGADCIFVNGVIENMGESRPKSNKVSNWNICPKKDGENYFCKISKGDFNKDGIMEVIMNNGTGGAPSKVTWRPYDVNSQGSLHLLGEIGSYWLP
jgi:hypothetical protein